jgi:hypothetical protein
MWCCSELRNLNCDGSTSSFPRRREPSDFALFSIIGKAFALTRESLFFACAKKSNQKKAHPGGAPSALRAADSQAGPEFSEGTSMCPPKTARIVRAALRVYPSLLAAPKGPRSSNSNSKRRLLGPILHSPFSIFAC